MSDPSAMEIRRRNQELNIRSRQICAEVGFLWYHITTRELWKEWGYSTAQDCIEQEGPRAYSTIQECVANYEFFVLKKGYSWQEYLQFVVNMGIRKVTSARRLMTIQSVPFPPPDNSTDPPEHSTRVEQPTSTLQEIEQKMAHLSLKQARAEVNAVAEQRGITVIQSIYWPFHFSEDQREMVKAAIDHIQHRATHPITDAQALALLCGEYLAEKGVRKIAA